jgi:hypothetical protein
LLRFLNIAFTKVADLSPLRGAPIEELHCDNTRITDFRPLFDLPKLDKVTLSERKRAIEVLRAHPTIRFQRGANEKDPYLTADEFWKQFDAWLAEEQRKQDAAADAERTGKK